MAETRSYNAKMNAKGLEKSVSEEQARHMALHQGSTYLFIVQAHAGPKTVDEDGSEKINLIPDLVELVPDYHAERVRVFMRALYLERPEQFGQGAFEAGDNEPSAEAAGADLDAVVEKDEAGEPTGIWTPDADDKVLVPDADGVPGGPNANFPKAEASESEQPGPDGGNVVAFSGSGKASG